MQPPVQGVTALPFYGLEKCSKPTLFLAYLRIKGFRCQSIASSFLCWYRGKNPLFSTLFSPFFHPVGLIERTGDKPCPETLLAAVDTFSANPVILPPAVFSEKEAPFGFPFLTAAHSSCSSLPGFPGSGGCRLAHSFFAWESCPRTEGFSAWCAFSSFRSPLLMIPSIMP